MRASLIALLACLLPAGALAQTPPAAPAGPPPPPPGCDSPESHQFDFWVGKWSVTPTGKDKHVADSLIEKLYKGCAVRENWMPLNGGSGGSLNSYLPSDKGWRQTWTDAAASWTEYRGGWNGEAMVLTAATPSPGHEHQQQRMTYTKNADGSVRQFGQTSEDDGKTWAPAFDFTYHPVK